MEKVEELYFKIDGEYITDLVRTFFWNEDKPYSTCEEILLNCLICDEISLNERKNIAQQIIEGKKKLVGINEFDLVDDNENVRSIFDKIEEQKQKFEIEKLKNEMNTKMIDYIDPYCASKSIEDAYYADVNSYDDCTTYFWYHDYAIDEKYMRPWIPGEDMLLKEDDETALGLWLYDYPEIAYKAIKKSNSNPSDSFSKDKFWEEIYNIIKDDKRFQNTAFDIRNEKYLASIRIKEKKITGVLLDVKKYVDEYLSCHTKPENDAPITDVIKYEHIERVKKRIEDPDVIDNLKYQILPDNYEEWEGLIAPNGDFYSCEFGGHNAKAYFILMCFPEKFPNLDYNNISHLNMTNALDEILNQGWCSTRYLPSCGDYIDIPTNKRITKAQKNAIMDAYVKHNSKADLSIIGY